MENLKLNILTEKLLELQKKKIDTENKLKEVKKSKSEVEEDLINLMLNMGIHAYKTEEGITLSSMARSYFSIRPQMKELLVNTIIEKNNKELLTVNAAKAVTFLEEYDIDVNEYISEYQKASISIRKS
ncbi:hypothetical protein KAU11_11400 [Candidatus Babeliales bacterium]|nr:hypothetical protein [Candidatus Babeliales bacterium]